MLQSNRENIIIGRREGEGKEVWVIVIVIVIEWGIEYTVEIRERSLGGVAEGEGRRYFDLDLDFLNGVYSISGIYKTYGIWGSGYGNVWAIHILSWSDGWWVMDRVLFGVGDREGSILFERVFLGGGRFVYSVKGRMGMGWNGWMAGCIFAVAMNTHFLSPGWERRDGKKEIHCTKGELFCWLLLYWILEREYI